MPKRKITPEILDTLELCAADAYTLENIREEADITRPLMKDPQIIDAIEKGRIKWFIEIASADGDLDSFIYCSGKTLDEVNQMFETHKEAIEKKKHKRRSRQTENSKNTLNAAARSGFNVYLQHDPQSREKINSWDIGDEIKRVAADLKSGDTSSLLEILVGNVTQLHVFNGAIANMLTTDENLTVDKMHKLSNMQMRILQEERKSIMAINEITNPKRAVFIKEANQHIHQQTPEKLLEKKDEKVSKLFQPKEEEVIDAYQYTEAETVATREN